MSAERKGRRPGPSTTREDILQATAEIVADEGIDKATIRRIAARAKVDPALIYRHFPDKSGLFDAVFHAVFASAPSYDEPITHGRQLVELALELWGNRARRAIGFGALRAALSNEQAASMLREVISRTVLRRVTEVARSDHRDLRAALIGSHLVGMVIVLYQVKVPGLVAASHEELVRAVAPVIEHYLHGDLGLPDEPPRRRRVS